MATLPDTHTTTQMYWQRFKSLEECFWEKCVKAGQEECWVWTGAIGHAGRANFRGRSAPRVAWELVNGSPGKLYVCHHCDNPACVNPSHLFLGTQKDNMGDCARKGRRSKKSRAWPGERHHNAKLTASDVHDMRWLAGLGVTRNTLADEFGVSYTQARRIVLGQRWGCEP